MSRRLLPGAGNSRAVVMGTWEYNDCELGPDLPAVKNSFDRFASLLTDPLCGWPAASITQVANEPDPGRVPDMLMTQFAAATDVALFYYVGHGLLSDDEDVQLCLGLTGTVKESHRVVPTSLEYPAVRRALLRSRARVKIVILDCCNSSLALPSRLGQTDVDTGEAVPEDFLDETGVERTYVLVAASKKYTYYENKPVAESPQTFFTKYLVDLVKRGIGGGPPQLTMELLFRRLSSDLKDGGHTRPAASGDFGGDYPFCWNVARTVELTGTADATGKHAAPAVPIKVAYTQQRVDQQSRWRPVSSGISIGVESAESLRTDSQLQSVATTGNSPSSAPAGLWNGLLGALQQSSGDEPDVLVAGEAHQETARKAKERRLMPLTRMVRTSAWLLFLSSIPIILRYYHSQWPIVLVLDGALTFGTAFLVSFVKFARVSTAMIALGSFCVACIDSIFLATHVLSLTVAIPVLVLTWLIGYVVGSPENRSH